MRHRILLPALIGALALAVLTGGCGEKIAIPVPEGLFSLSDYTLMNRHDDAFARDVTVVNGLLYVLGGDGSLVKRSQEYLERERLEGLDDPTALCADDDNGIIFVWEDGAKRLGAYTAGDLVFLHASELPDVQRGTHIATNRTGVEIIDPAIHTFVYITDPDSGVVHRYAYYIQDGTMVDTGILCRDGGLSVRYANAAEGLLRDSEGMMWVCDTDTTRNWVIRFDPTPDLEDTSSDPERPDPLSGRAALVDADFCLDEVAAEYVLGDAPGCDGEWEPGPRDATGAFDVPLSLGTDGAGRIYVADHANDRLQIFDSAGYHDLSFYEEDMAPLSFGVIDKVESASEIFYGAYIFVISEGSGQVLEFVSEEELNSGDPPEPED